MSDKVKLYRSHPQPLNCQIPLDVIENPLNFEGNELLDYLTHQPDIVAELNITGLLMTYQKYTPLIQVQTLSTGQMCLMPSPPFP